MLAVTNVSHSYPKAPRPALNNISFELSGGGVIALVGHNGAGKSTLIDIICGLQPPTTGTVERSVPREELGWCPQREIVDWSLTVRQNITLVRDLAVGRPDTLSVDDLASLLGLSNYLDKPMENVSGGELRRTMIARALIAKPVFTVLDEPTVGLDPDGVDTVFEYLRDRAQRDNALILVSTHETTRFTPYCDRVLALDQGDLVADSPLNEFLGHGRHSDIWAAYKELILEGTNE